MPTGSVEFRERAGSAVGLAEGFLSGADMWRVPWAEGLRFRGMERGRLAGAGLLELDAGYVAGQEGSLRTE